MSLFLRAHRVARAGAAAGVLALLASLTDGRMIPIPQIISGSFRSVPFALFLAAFHAGVTLWAFPAGTLRVEARATRPMWRYDVSALALVHTPTFVIAGLASVTTQGSSVALDLARNATVCGAIAIVASAFFAPELAAIMPAGAIIAVASLSGGARTGPMGRAILLNAAGPVSTALAASALLATVPVLGHRRRNVELTGHAS